MYTLTSLQEGTEYSITVTASLSGGGTTDSSLTANTVTASESNTGSPKSTLSLIRNILSAPSAPPFYVAVTGVTSSTITVQWGSVPCVHQNGDITGYWFLYGAIGSGSTQTLIVDASTTQTSITGLNPSTTYSIEVAAVNIAGTGVYSEPETNNTLPSEAAMLIKRAC